MSVEVEHHMAGEDGETMGWRFKNGSRSIWCGEISRAMFESQLDGYQHDLCGGSDMGWFIVEYDERKPQGEQARILARVLDEETGREVAAALAEHN